MKTAKEIIDDNTFVKDGLITVETAIKCMEQYAEQQVKKLNIDDVSKPLDGELQEALNEFSKTQGTKEPKKKRF